MSAAACVPSTFTNPALFGAEFLSITAEQVTNFQIKDYPAWLNPLWHNEGNFEIKDADFCNVTVTYTHPGQGDNLKVDLWMPPAEKWNKRLQARGGGGYVAGGTGDVFMQEEMVLALMGGYVASTRDSGFGNDYDARNWALASEGNVNLYNLQNLGSVSLDDEAFISKSIIKDFYGSPPSYSYWNGCSQGGRQGMQLAQTNPSAYNGILAMAPAINFNRFFIGMFWPQLIMNLAGEYPLACELDTLTAAAVAECDPHDGYINGFISEKDAELCKFDPFAHVGDAFNCSGNFMPISEIAAKVAHAAWTGPRTEDGRFLWHGVGYGSDLSGAFMGDGVGKTVCHDNGTCAGNPVLLVDQWIRLFVQRNPNFDITTMTHAQFEDIFNSAVRRFSNFIESNNPDLSRFKAAGGKILTWHGIDDQLIPYNGTLEYYNAVSVLDPKVNDFYKLYPVPGIQHCMGGSGAIPRTSTVLDALVKWVEEGISPESLPVGTADMLKTTGIICPLPLTVKYDGSGARDSLDSYNCA